MKLFTIPNIITLLNLLCGCLAIVFAFDGNLAWSAYLVGIAAVLDFLDGFVARLLKQYSEIGKQLDSLADMVTFGLVPGVVMFQLIHYSLIHNGEVIYSFFHQEWLPYVAFVITLFSALRLAKFNIDTRQSDSFIGVPTPANAILICSFALILNVPNINMARSSMPMDENNPENVLALSSYLAREGQTIEAPVASHSTNENPYWDCGEYISESNWVQDILINKWFLIGVTLVMSVLLISEIPLFALKFKSFGWKGNEIRWSFLGLCVVLLVTLKFVGIPLAIVLYIIMSVINNLVTKKEARR